MNDLLVGIKDFFLFCEAVGICAIYTGLVLAVPVVSVMSVIEKKERF